MSKASNPTPTCCHPVSGICSTRTGALRDQLSDLRVGLCKLLGYHESDGQVPVEKIDALLEGRASDA